MMIKYTLWKSCISATICGIIILLTWANSIGGYVICGHRPRKIRETGAVLSQIVRGRPIIIEPHGLPESPLAAMRSTSSSSSPSSSGPNGQPKKSPTKQNPLAVIITRTKDRMRQIWHPRKNSTNNRSAQIQLVGAGGSIKVVMSDKTTNDGEESIASSKQDHPTNHWHSKIAARNVDLSGTWRPITTPEFKQKYDEYLQNCSQSYMFRQVVLNGISLQKEVIRQLDEGERLEIVGINPAGSWNRTIVATSNVEPRNTTIQDPDGDMVQVEAWWEQNGTVHRSWLRDKPRVRGGAFETVRYLDGDDILVCESSFHPSTESSNKNFQYGHVVWKFKKES